MMWDSWWGWPWMMLMPLVWLVLILVIVWAVVRLARQPSDDARHGRETAQEILDRRFARGEIDADEYRQAQAQLAGRDPDS